jgi:hypothetical protein
MVSERCRKRRPRSFRHLLGRLPSVWFQSVFKEVSKAFSWKGSGIHPPSANVLRTVLPKRVPKLPSNSLPDRCRNGAANLSRNGSACHRFGRGFGRGFEAGFWNRLLSRQKWIAANFLWSYGTGNNVNEAVLSARELTSRRHQEPERKPMSLGSNQRPTNRPTNE